MKRNIKTKVNLWKIVCYSSFIPHEAGRESELVGDSLEDAINGWIRTNCLLSRDFQCKIYKCDKGTMIKFKKKAKPTRQHAVRYLVVE